MAVDLSEYVSSLRREVTPLGSDPFSTVTDTQWTDYLADSFWEARLDGFLQGWTADEDGVVSPVPPNTLELPREQIAAIIIYAGVRVLRNKILNTNTTFRAKAGPVEYETQNSATMLAEMLKQLKAVKDRLLDGLTESDATSVAYIDAYSARLGIAQPTLALGSG